MGVPHAQKRPNSCQHGACYACTTRHAQRTFHPFPPSFGLCYHHEVISSSNAQLFPLYRICHSPIFFRRMVSRPKGETCRWFSGKSLCSRTVICRLRICICSDSIRYRNLILGQAPYLQTSWSLVQLIRSEHLWAIERKTLGRKGAADYRWQLSRCDCQWASYGSTGERQGLGDNHVCNALISPSPISNAWHPVKIAPAKLQNKTSTLNSSTKTSTRRTTNPK